MRLKMMKRVLSLLLLVSMVLSLMLPGVSAAEPPQELRNVALGKSVTSGWGEDVPYWAEPNEISFVTDGETYSDPGIGQNNTFMLDRRPNVNPEPGEAEFQYITIDLGQSYDISQIKYFGSVPGDEGYVNISKNMVFRVSNDPNFQDESTKTVFNSDRENTWGFGAGTDTDEANTHEGRTITFEPVNARYVRYYQNAAKQGIEGTTLSDLPWLSACEIEVYAQVPVVTESRNVASHKPVTSGWGDNVQYWKNENVPAFVTDGDTSSAVGTTYHMDRRGGEISGTPSKPEDMYITIDLGQDYPIEKIVYFGEFADSNTWMPQNVVIRAAKTADFSDAVTVFNNDAENLWGFGAGTDSEAVSTAAGRTIVLAEPVEARYVRYYQRNVNYNNGQRTWESLELAELEVYAQVPVDLTEYAVTFQPENGQAEFTQMVRTGTAAKQPETPEKEGYYFLGWTLDGESYDFNTPVTQDITLVAKWVDEDENMEPNGKAQPAGNYAWGLTATFSYVKNGEEISLDSSSMQQSDRIQNLTDGNPNKNNWVSPPESYTVAANGPAYMQVDLGGWATINEIVTWQYVDRSYYQAVQVSANGSNWTTVYNNDEEDARGLKTACGPNLAGSYDALANETASGNHITFEAQKVRYIRFWSGGWSKAESPWIHWVQLQAFHNQTVTFDNGLEGEAHETWEIRVPHGTAAVQPEDPVQDNTGFVFDYWKLEGGEGAYDFTTPVTGDLTLVAVWKEVGTSTVTLDYNDGTTASQTMTVTNGGTVTLPENPTRQGYHFGGWKLQGAPFNPETPITEDITLKAAWVPAQSEDAVKIAAGLVDYYLDTTGKITNIVSRVDETDYAPSGDYAKFQKSNLISLIADGAHHEPTGLTVDGNVLTFEFATVNTQVDVEFKQKESYTTFEVVRVAAPGSVHVETLLWGPIRNTLGDVVGESMGTSYNWDFALGIHSLNDKTVGGWPQEWIKLSHRPGPYQQDDTYLAGMSWQHQLAVVAPVKYDGQDDPTSNVYNPDNPEGGWGGSFFQAFTTNYEKPHEQIVGGFPWINDWHGNYRNFDQDNFELGHSFQIVADAEVPALVNSAYPEDAYIARTTLPNGEVAQGSAIALFGCKQRNMLNTIEEIELNEDLPHPTVDGEWIKKAPAVKGSETSGSFNTGNIDAIAKAAADSGFKFVYWISGAVGPFVHNGSFRYNSSWGGSDYAAKTQVCDVAAQYGVYTGTHSMSSYIANGGGNDNLYLTDYGAHPDLAYAATTVLTRPLSADETTIYIADDRCFGEIWTGGRPRYARIGSEIIQYSDVVRVGSGEYMLTNCQRGARGTGSYVKAYPAGASCARLQQSVYNAMLSGYSLAKDVATRQGQAFNNAGVHDMSCDGLEDSYKNGYNQLAMNRYASQLWDACDDRDGFYFVNSSMFSNQWDMLSFERWNRALHDNMPNFHVGARSDQGDSVTDPRAYMMQRNLFAQMYNIRVNNPAVLGLDCSGVAALDGGMNTGYLNGLNAEMRAQLKAWTDAIEHNAFTQQQKQDFFNTYVENESGAGVSWKLDTVVEGQEWTLTKYETDGSNFTNPIGEPVTVRAAKKLNFTADENGNVAASLSMEHVTGVDPNATNKLRAAFPGTVNQNAQPGDTVIVSPQADMGYTCAGVRVETAGGEAVELTPTNDGYGTYTFTMPKEDVAITAEFVKDGGFKAVEVYNDGSKAAGTGSVTVGESENGTISVSGSTVTATPKEGYRFLQANVEAANGDVVYVENGDNTATFTMPDSNVTVYGVFVPVFTVETDGSVTADLTEAAEGDLVVIDTEVSDKEMVPGTLVVQAEDGSYIPTHVVYDDGDYLKYEFSMPASNVTITAAYQDADTHQVSANYQAEQGTVTVSPANPKTGDVVTFTVQAKDGYIVDSVYPLDNSGNQPSKIQAADGVFRKNSNRISGSRATVAGSFVMPDGDITLNAYFASGEAQESADKTELQALYNANKDKPNDNYTEESWAVFQKALDEAKAVLDDETATQTQVDAAENALKKAVEELTEQTEAVDKTALQALYDANKNRPNRNYTEESWTAFQKALAKAKVVLDDENATQTQVDAAEQALSKAIDKLEKKGGIDWPIWVPSVPDEKPSWELPFTDVAEGAWYYESVYYAWDENLIDGVTADKYQPDGSLTVAQTIKLAAALHEKLNRGYVTLENGTANWYDTYVDYAVNNGIIEAKYQSYTKAQMDAAITRNEFVHIFHGAMDDYKAINDVADNAIPDVKVTDAYADEIYDFYRAGILTGSDGAGTFNGKTTIKRSEVAAILVRMYDDSMRQKITLS